MLRANSRFSVNCSSTATADRSKRVKTLLNMTKYSLYSEKHQFYGPGRSANVRPQPIKDCMSRRPFQAANTRFPAYA